MPREYGERLRAAIERDLPKLRQVGESEASERPGADNWSRKEELGHLIDSATNNHVRFVRTTLEAGYRGPSYDGAGWVRLQGYDKLPWVELVELWYRHNWLLAHLAGEIPEERINAWCEIGGEATGTLGFVIDDYVRHMQHHLDHILGRQAAAG